MAGDKFPRTTLYKYTIQHNVLNLDTSIPVDVKPAVPEEPEDRAADVQKTFNDATPAATNANDE